MGSFSAKMRAKKSHAWAPLSKIIAYLTSLINPFIIALLDMIMAYCISPPTPPPPTPSSPHPLIMINLAVPASIHYINWDEDGRGIRNNT